MKPLGACCKCWSRCLDRKTFGLIALALCLACAAIGLSIHDWMKRVDRAAALRDVPAQRVSEMPLPDFASMTPVAERKRAFFEFTHGLVKAQNAEIQSRRARVQAQLRRLEANVSIALRDRQLLQDWLAAYGVKGDAGEAGALKRLLHRMDIIAPSLAMAQAANESAWGTSRFAREGNNLFGQWCFQPGCGLAPAQRSYGATHEVRVFESPYASIASYMHNLNTHRAYAPLRSIRSRLRDQSAPITGLALVEGIRSYSQERDRYVSWIRQIIIANGLNDLDLADQVQ